MLVVKSLILTTLVESARLSKHVYEAKLATEVALPDCPAGLAWGSGLNPIDPNGQCNDRHSGACYSEALVGQDGGKITTQCLSSGKIGSYKCPSEASTKCSFKTLHFSDATPDAACTTESMDPYASGKDGTCCDGLEKVLKRWTNSGRKFYLCKKPESDGVQECPAGLAFGSGLNPIDPNGQCNGDHAGACYSEALVGQDGGKITTQCLKFGKIDAYKCPSEASTKCKFANQHFSLAEEEEEVALPGCPKETGTDGNGLCENGYGAKHAGACYEPSLVGQNGDKLKTTTQCLPTGHLKSWYKCPKNAPVKCTYSAPVPDPTPSPPSNLKKCPKELAWGSGMDKIDPNGQCNGGHAGACYSEALVGRNGGKITTQCLPDGHLGDWYKCPPEASTKCEFATKHFSLAEEEEEVALPRCPAKLAWGSGKWPIDPNGQCNGRHSGACYNPSLVGRNGGKITTQCLPYGHLKSWYKCPSEASTKCEFANQHFSLAEEEEEVALPGCPKETGTDGNGLCENGYGAFHAGACYEPSLVGQNGDKLKTTTQCLPTGHLKSWYKCPKNAPVKCTYSAPVPDPTPSKPSGLDECPKELAWGSGMDKIDPNGQCDGGHAGACYSPALVGQNGGKITTQCLPAGHLGDWYKCPKEASTKCEFATKHFSLAEVNEMEGAFKLDGTDEGNCLCYYGGRTHYCNHGGNGMCVCGMNSWDWKRQSDYSQCGHHR